MDNGSRNSTRITRTCFVIGKIVEPIRTDFLSESLELKESGFDMAVSQDVLYHLTEELVYNHHLETLFSLSRRLVIIYTHCPMKDYREYRTHWGPFYRRHVFNRPDLVYLMSKFRHLGWILLAETYKARSVGSEAGRAGHNEAEMVHNRECNVFYVFVKRASGVSSR